MSYSLTSKCSPKDQALDTRFAQVLLSEDCRQSQQEQALLTSRTCGQGVDSDHNNSSTALIICSVSSSTPYKTTPAVIEAQVLHKPNDR